MKYHDLRDFLTLLEQQGELKRITLPVDPHLEITEIADRTLRAGGPALLFENPKGYTMPVLCNLFGTPRRVALGMGQEDVSSLREVGKLLAFLKEPEPPKGFRDLFDKLPQFKQVLNMPTKRLRGAPCQQKIIQGDDVDLRKIPIMTCWPDDAAPLILALDAIRDRGLCLLMEAHAGHAKGANGTRDLRPRGSSALLGWPEFGFGLDPHETDNNAAWWSAWRGWAARCRQPARSRRR